MNRRRIFNLIAVALVALAVPVVATAQGGYDPYGRNRDNGRNRNYDARGLRDVARRVSDRSRDFQRHLDSSLDRSRIDDTRREDNINQIANEFRNAAGNFRNRINDGRDGNRASNEAHRLIQLGSRIDGLMARARLDSRTESDWAQIRQDLRVIADFYGINFNSRGNGGYGGRNDDYENNRRRDNRRGTNDEWWRRLPFPN